MTDRKDVGAIRTGWGLLPRSAWLRGGREEVPDHLRMSCQKTALRRAVILSNCTPGFPLAEPTEVNLPGQKPCGEKGGQLTYKGKGKIAGACLK